MLLFINVVSINYLLCDVLIKLCEVNSEIEDNRQILILKGVYSLSNAVFICNEISFLEIYLFLYYILQRVEHLLLNLQGYHKNVCLDVLNYTFIVIHQIQKLIPGRLFQVKSLLSIRRLCNFSRKRVNQFNEIVQSIPFSHVIICLWYFKCPLEDLLFSNGRT